MRAVIQQINGHLLTQDPRGKISGVTPVRLSRLDAARVVPVAMYLPRPIATTIGVGAHLAGFEIRVGTLSTAKKDALAAP